MGLFKKRADKDEKSGQLGAGPSSSNSPQTGAPNNQYGLSNHEKSGLRDEENYVPPPGPPPSWRKARSDEEYMPPPVPPPVQHRLPTSPSEDYQAPPGPPPSWQRTQSNAEDFVPPAGPPPSWRPHVDEKSPNSQPSLQASEPDQPPPSYHDWQSAVPDTSLLPPPPVAPNIMSMSSNASTEDAERAWDWCVKHPLVPPQRPDVGFVRKSLLGDISLQPPSRFFPGKLTEVRGGVWSGTTKAGAGDQCFLTTIPLYFALSDQSPKMCGRMRTVYYEIHFNHQGRSDAGGNEPSLAIGYAAQPYPTWRMPGWERGSLAVHSDDGCRFVNNQEGGQDFVAPFNTNDVVGLGVRYWVGSHDTSTSGGLQGEVFFTRNGTFENSWSLQEETDEQNQYGNWGVSGDHDLYAAIGTFGEVAFKAVFQPDSWLFKPEQAPLPVNR